MDTTIYVTAELAIKPNNDIDKVKQLIEQFCQDMESEAGCLQATATYDANEPNRVILWERYLDREAIEAHFSMPHTKRFIELGITDLVQVFNTGLMESTQ